MLIDLLIVFGIILLLQVVFFIYAVINRTDKVTDLSYGLTFVVGSITSLLIGIDNISLFKIILFSLISVWGLRISVYLFIRILKTGRDKRFDGIREDFKRFGSFWLLQALSVYIILIPTTYILLVNRDVQFNAISIIGLTVSILGLILESIADYQKYVFKNRSENKDRWIDTGLWKYSRHPNYLGEIMMWLGVFIYVIPYIKGIEFVTVISPIYITYLLLFVTGIPTLEKKYDTKYKGNNRYMEYKSNTGLLFPKIFK